MSDYKLTGWTLSGVPNGGPHAHGTTFHITIDFTQNSHAQYIKRVGNVVDLNRTVGVATGTNVTKTGSNVVAGATGSTLDIALQGGIIHSGNVAIPANTPWFQGYAYPSDPGGGSPANVTWQAYLNNPNGGGIANDLEFDISYLPEFGQFNPIQSDHVITQVVSRAETIADYEIEWHDNASYTSLIASGSGFIWATSPGSFTEFWMRSRPIGAVGWTNLGSVSFFDPR